MFVEVVGIILIVSLFWVLLERDGWRLWGLIVVDCSVVGDKVFSVWLEVVMFLKDGFGKLGCLVRVWVIVVLFYLVVIGVFILVVCVGVGIGLVGVDMVFVYFVEVFLKFFCEVNWEDFK